MKVHLGMVYYLIYPVMSNLQTAAIPVCSRKEYPIYYECLPPKTPQKTQKLSAKMRELNTNTLITSKGK